MSRQYTGRDVLRLLFTIGFYVFFILFGLGALNEYGEPIFTDNMDIIILLLLGLFPTYLFYAVLKHEWRSREEDRREHERWKRQIDEARQIEQRFHESLSDEARQKIAEEEKLAKDWVERELRRIENDTTRMQEWKERQPKRHKQ